jgi:hypothetical protein
MQKAPNRSAQQGRQEIKKTEDNHRISQAKNNRLIVVLGMHRSGTSAISAGLKVLGVEFGDRLLPPVKGDNDKGYWEDIDLNKFNIKCLNAIDSDWNSLSAITANDIAILKKQGYFLNAVNLLRQKVRINAPIFGFKDPRVAKLFPFWKQVFDYCKLDVNYVLAIRHPLSVVKSLIKRDDMFAEHCYFLWVSHVITSMAAYSCNNCLVVDYDRMMQSPDKELNRIAIAFDLKIDQSALLTYKTEFLDNGLRHTTYELDDLFLDDTCPPIAAEIYKSLLQVASDKIKFDDIDLCSDIERWRNEFDRLECSLVLVDTLIEQKKVNTQILINSEGQNARLSQTVAEKDLHIANLDQVIEERDEQLEKLEQDLTERDERLAVQNEQIGAYHLTVLGRDEQIVKLEQDLTERDERLAVQNEQIGAYHLTVLGRDEQIVKLEQDLMYCERLYDQIRKSIPYRLMSPLVIIKKLFVR